MENLRGIISLTPTFLAITEVLLKGCSQEGQGQGGGLRGRGGCEEARQGFGQGGGCRRRGRPGQLSGC
eukprot:3855293-Heterocapsa_arctica.AAC.1